MHELSLALDLLSAIDRNLDRGDARVVRVSVGVGAAAGIVSGSLRFAFRVICEGTRADYHHLNGDGIDDWLAEINNVRQSFLIGVSA
jgi:Zn finger protein HypA/HybF involved in hydrogenase expression